ncbi:MAG: hypothetical protein ACRC33_23495 [Gemmataceae bacterium]
MQPTCEGILDAGKIEWIGPAPAGGPGRVRVTLVESPAPSDGPRMAAALERLAAEGLLIGMEDPLAWQREQRADRPLAG